MRFRPLTAAILATLLIGATSGASPEEQWRAAIAENNRQWSATPHAFLKMQDEFRLLDGQSVTLIGTTGEPASYRLLAGKQDGILTVTLLGGTLTASMHGETLDDAALRTGISVDTDIELQGRLVPKEQGGFAGILLFNQVRAEAVNFKGLDYFPYDPAYRVTATFRPDPNMAPRVFRVSQGADRPYFHVGDATFTLNGKDFTLPFYAASNDARRLNEMVSFFVDDLTGTETYGGGRYINIDGFGQFPPLTVTIDFNFAYNPLCARSPFFSCPIAVDAIGTAIKAGEKDPHQAH